MSEPRKHYYGARKSPYEVPPTLVVHEGELVRVAEAHGRVSGSAGPVNRGDRLQVGERLDEGECLTSANGTFTLSMQTDGNLVLYYKTAQGAPSARWASNTVREPDAPPHHVELTDGGLFVCKPDRTPVWTEAAPPSAASKPVSGRLEDDGAFTVYDVHDSVLWIVAGGAGGAGSS